MAAQPQTALTILRRRQVEARTGLSRSTLYGKLKRNPKRPKEFDETFPAPVKLGPGAKAVGWIESEIDTWLTAQVEASRKTTTTAKG
jgi:prophage regulatory protein